ncbi:MAG: aldo/keto reductase [Deltaproteobacteria bacterium]|nr:aldo/keto reductase [Deltaproteobacteria bacterium]
MSNLIPNRIIIGTSRLGSVVGTPKRQFKFLDSVVEAGFKTFDLAASYQIGGTERMFGRWIQQNQRRENLFLISKGGHPYPFISNRLSILALRADLESSLKRLRTDYLDLFLLHRDHPKADLNAIAEFLVAMRDSGKIKAFGVSNWYHERIAELDIDIAASSVHFSKSPWEKPPFKGVVSIAGHKNQPARDFYAETQIPILAWSPVRGLNKEEVQDSLRYLASQKFPVYPILGSRKLKHLLENQEIFLQELG